MTMVQSSNLIPWESTIPARPFHTSALGFEKCCSVLTGRSARDYTLLLTLTARSKKSTWTEVAIFSCLARRVQCSVFFDYFSASALNQNEAFDLCQNFEIRLLQAWQSDIEQFYYTELFEKILPCAVETNFVVIERCCLVFSLFLRCLFSSFENRYFEQKRRKDPIAGEMETSEGMFYESKVPSMSAWKFDGVDEYFALSETPIDSQNEALCSLQRLVNTPQPAQPRLNA